MESAIIVVVAFVSILIVIGFGWVCLKNNLPNANNNVSLAFVLSYNNNITYIIILSNLFWHSFHISAKLDKEAKLNEGMYLWRVSILFQPLPIPHILRPIPCQLGDMLYTASWQ